MLSPAVTNRVVFRLSGSSLVNGSIRAMRWDYINDKQQSSSRCLSEDNSHHSFLFTQLPVFITSLLPLLHLQPSTLPIASIPFVLFSLFPKPRISFLQRGEEIFRLFTLFIMDFLSLRDESASESDNGSFKLYHYEPTKVGALIFVVLFLGTSVFHTWQLFRARSWFVVPLVIGGFRESLVTAHPQLKLC